MDERVRNQQAFIHRCQLKSGTFRLSPRSDVINPYFTNLGLMSLIDLGDCEPVKQHLNWYLNHLSSDGYVSDYRLRQQEEFDTRTADSEDSYHATFFSLLLAYIRQTEDTSWLAVIYPKLTRIFTALSNLQRSDGLTWAKRTYKVKYLMDNCEVYQGFLDAAALFSIIGDPSLAHKAVACADSCKTGIRSLYRASSKCFAIYTSKYPKFSKWYPDATSQAFPIIYQLLEPESEKARFLYHQIIRHFPRFDEFETGDYYPWMSIGECAFLMGDMHRVERMVNAADTMYINGSRQPYWLLHEAGRYIQLRLRLAR